MGPGTMLPGGRRKRSWGGCRVKVMSLRPSSSLRTIDRTGPYPCSNWRIGRPTRMPTAVARLLQGLAEADRTDAPAWISSSLWGGSSRVTP